MRKRTSKLVVTRAHLWAIVGCILLRLVLLPLQDWLAGRLELSTRAQSWERANEVIFRQRKSAHLNVNPALLVLRAIMPSKYAPNGEWLSSGWLPFVIFIVVDILTGILLSQNSGIILEEEEPMLGEKNVELQMEETMKPSMAENPLTTPKLLPLTIFCIYILNPLTAALCVARGIAIAVCTLCYDARAVFLIISVTTLPHWGRVYKGLGINHITVGFRKKKDVDNSTVSSSSSFVSDVAAASITTTTANNLFPLRLWKLTSCLAGFSLTFVLAAVIAWASTASFDPAIFFFMESIAIQDLTPTVGLHWYFFQQIFTEFRGYFCVLLGWHMLAYIGPLTIRMAGDMPHAYMDAIAMIVTIFRPFPSFADLVLLVCLGNAHPRILGRMNWLTFMTLGIGVPMFMIPAMLHVWLMAGTANANYLFFQTLAYNVFLCLGILQFINGAMKRRKYLQQTIKTIQKEEDPSKSISSKS